METIVVTEDIQCDKTQNQSRLPLQVLSASPTEQHSKRRKLENTFCNKVEVKENVQHCDLVKPPETIQVIDKSKTSSKTEGQGKEMTGPSKRSLPYDNNVVKKKRKYDFIEKLAKFRRIEDCLVTGTEEAEEVDQPIKSPASYVSMSEDDNFGESPGKGNLDSSFDSVSDAAGETTSKGNEKGDSSYDSVKDGQGLTDPLVTPTLGTPIPTKKRKLTPKQLEKRAESERKRKEQLQQRLEKELKRQEEKEKRLKFLEEKRKEKEEREEAKRKEREDKEEAKRKEREDKEEAKKKEREDKEKKRLAQLEQKSEEKKAKEDEKRKKEEQKLEEKKKKDEELLKKKLEEEKKKAKEKAAFSSFFKKVEPKTREDVVHEKLENFMPFTVKPDMRLAPINRNPLSSRSRDELDRQLEEQLDTETYVFKLRSGEITPHHSDNTWPSSEKDDIAILSDDLDLCEITQVDFNKDKVKAPRAKLLQFHENRRPPYWGTWRKKSAFIRPRKPLGVDKIFDYEVDSDDEWEEEEPGESLHGSDDDKESEDDYEVDNDFFVPHGYLSDEENQDDEAMSPEAQKAKLKLLGEQFEAEMSEKTKQLKPICIGCICFNGDVCQNNGVSDNIIRLLSMRKGVVWNVELPIKTSKEEDKPKTSDTTGTGNQYMKKFPETSIPDLIRLIHGNLHSKNLLKNEFFEFYRRTAKTETDGDESPRLGLTKASIIRQIKEIALWEEFPELGPMVGKFCWVVRKDVREKYGLDKLEVPSSWEYITKMTKGKEKDDDGDDTPKAKVKLVQKLGTEEEKQVTPKEADNEQNGVVKKFAPTTLITKFTKVLSDEERKIQLTMSTPTSTPSTSTKPEAPSQSVTPKSNQKSIASWINSSNKQKTGKEDKQPAKKRVKLITLSKNVTKTEKQLTNAIIVDLDVEEMKQETTQSKVSVEDNKGHGKEENKKIEEEERKGGEVKVGMNQALAAGKVKAKKRCQILLSVPKGKEITPEMKSAALEMKGGELKVNNPFLKTKNNSQVETVKENGVAMEVDCIDLTES